jgi:hypothetical protein
MKNKYEIEYKGKKYYQYGEDCEEAMSKFANRKVFGQSLIFSYSLKMYDADTRGKYWAQYKTNDNLIVMVSHVQT